MQLHRTGRTRVPGLAAAPEHARRPASTHPSGGDQSCDPRRLQGKERGLPAPAAQPRESSRRWSREVSGRHAQWRPVKPSQELSGGGASALLSRNGSWGGEGRLLADLRKISGLEADGAWMGDHQKMLCLPPPPDLAFSLIKSSFNFGPPVLLPCYLFPLAITMK